MSYYDFCLNGGCECRRCILRKRDEAIKQRNAALKRVSDLEQELGRLEERVEGACRRASAAAEEMLLLSVQVDEAREFARLHFAGNSARASHRGECGVDSWLCPEWLTRENC